MPRAANHQADIKHLGMSVSRYQNIHFTGEVSTHPVRVGGSYKKNWDLPYHTPNRIGGYSSFRCLPWADVFALDIPHKGDDGVGFFVLRPRAYYNRDATAKPLPPVRAGITISRQCVSRCFCKHARHSRHFLQPANMPRCDVLRAHRYGHIMDTYVVEAVWSSLVNP